MQCVFWISPTKSAYRKASPNRGWQKLYTDKWLLIKRHIGNKSEYVYSFGVLQFFPLLMCIHFLHSVSVIDMYTVNHTPVVFFCFFVAENTCKTLRRPEVKSALVPSRYYLWPSPMPAVTQSSAKVFLRDAFWNNKKKKERKKKCKNGLNSISNQKFLSTLLGTFIR